MVGYVRRRWNGVGRVRWMGCYQDVRGRERSAGTFSRRRDADRAWRRAEAEVLEGRFVDLRSGRQRFARYVVDVWLPNHVMEVNTRQGYVQTVERYLVPAFGSMRMNEILPMHVRDFVRMLQERGVSAHVVQRCKTVLSGIFTTALHDRVIFLHPCTGVRVPTPPARPFQVLTPNELESILAVLPDEEWRLLVEVAIGSGARWGELTELRVSDLDRVANLVTVSRSVAEIRPRFHPCGGRFLVKNYPKNEHYRRVSVDAALVARLDRYITDRRLRTGDLLFPFPTCTPAERQPGSSPPVAEAGGVTEPNRVGRCYRHGTMAAYSLGQCRCTHCRAAYANYRTTRRQAGLDRPATGRPVATDGHLPRYWFRRQIWKPALVAAGIDRPMRFHGLRHAHASWLLAGGADLQTVRERLGHDSLRATEKYLHTVPRSPDVGLAALARIRNQAAPDTNASDHAVDALRD